MNKKAVTLSLLSLFALAGCGEQESTSSVTPPAPSVRPTPSEKTPRTFEERYSDLKKPRTVTGTAKEILVNKNGGEDSVLNNTITVLFGATSFHIEQSGDSESIVSTVYTDETGKALHYYINAQNEVEYEVITDKKTKEEVLFKEYDNPFKYVDSSLFAENSDGDYSVDLSNKDNKDSYNFLVNNLTYIDFQRLAQTYSETFEDITLKVEDEQIKGIHILSKDFTDTLGTTRFEWDLSFDYSETTDHSYPLPSPLETKDYHRTLQAALETLLDPESAYTTTITQDWGDGNLYTDVTYFDKDVVYLYSPDYETRYGAFIEKEDGVHEVVQAGSSYYYSPNVYQDKGTEYKKLSELYPTLGVAVQWFTYDSEKDTYTLTGGSAGTFGYFILTERFVDQQVAASDTVTITLTSDHKKVEKRVFGTTPVITATFEYGKKPESLSFDPKALTEKGTFSGFGGTYSAKISNDETWTIVVDEEKETVTINGTAATDIHSNKYDELEFTYSGEVYSINTKRTRLYKGRLSYPLSLVTDGE